MRTLRKLSLGVIGSLVAASLGTGRGLQHGGGDEIREEETLGSEPDAVAVLHDLEQALGSVPADRTRERFGGGDTEPEREVAE